MKIFLMAIALVFSLTANAESLSAAIGVKPNFGKGSCPSKSLKDADGFLGAISMKGNFDWALQNCKVILDITKSDYPDYAKRLLKMEDVMYTALRQCYSSADIQVITDKLYYPPDWVKNCDNPMIKNSFATMLGWLKNY